MKMSQAKLRELCNTISIDDGSDLVQFGKIQIRRADATVTGVSLGNVRVVVFKDYDMIARGRFNDLSRFIIQEIRNQP